MFGVQTARNRVDEVGPLGMERPQVAPTETAEMALVLALGHLPRVLQPGTVHLHVRSTRDLEGRGIGARVDRIAAPTRRLDANRAIATHVRDGMFALCGVFHGTAGARAKDLHAAIRARGRPACNRKSPKIVVG